MRKNILSNRRNITQYFTERNKIILLSLLIILSSSTSILSASALSYSSNVGLEFDVNPSISVSISGDLVISNLSLGSASNSNEIVVSVSTNNVSGYNLTANVGNDNTYTSNSLLHSNSTSTFDSINYETSTDNYLSSLTTPSTWGYSIDSGTSYNGLPYKNNGAATLTTTGTIPESGIDTTNFLIGALASSNQIAGEYNNVINFYATTNLPPTSLDDAFASAGKTKHDGYYYIQDMNSTICNDAEIGSITKVLDSRDYELYTISRLKDGRCWLLDNLRLDPTDPTTAANMNEDNTNAPATAIYNYLHGGNPDEVDGWTKNAATTPTNFYGAYNTPILSSINKNAVTAIKYGNGSNKIGIYYNFCAVSIGTYCYGSSSATDDSDYDICPINWEIPTISYTNTLLNSYSSTLATDKTSLQYALSITLSGFYSYTGSLQNENSYGYIWTSSFYDGGHMFHPLFTASYARPADYDDRRSGLPVRCIAK